MAVRKSSKSNKKAPSRPSSKTAAPKRKPAGQKSGSRAARKSTPAKTSSRSKPGVSPLASLGKRLKGSGGDKSGSGSSKSAQPAPIPRPAIRTKLSLDRKLDILGVGLAFVGLLTTLSMLSPINSSLVEGWVILIGKAFGSAMYIFPFGLIVSGGWLVLRNFDRIPQLALERILGLLLLFVNILVSLHMLVALRTEAGIFDLAAAGRGGGYLGATLLQLLNSAFGVMGTTIALFAWGLIALALALDVTVLELFNWLAPIFSAIKSGVAQLFGSRQITPAKLPPEALLDTDFMPLNRASGPVTTASALTGGPGAGMPADSLAEQRNWVLPPIDDILDVGGEVNYDDELDRQRAHVIEETLSSFGAPAKVVEINRGPTITQFGVEPDFVESRSGRMRVRVGKIAALADDLALALSARTIRIQAPVPGKGFVGIEVPNEEIAMVALRDMIESEAFRRLHSPLAFALGQNVAGMAVAADLAKMPHLLIAGATGSGKSVCVNSLICGLLLSNTPDELRLIMVDPKRVELTGYNGIPHLLAPVVVDLERVIGALQWVTREMDMRYRKLAEDGSRNIQDYNAKRSSRGEKKLPYLVVIIDELADLMMLAPDETERTVTRLAQLARATGIHLVIATQRPSVDVVTGLIKANFPARVAFAVASGVDSRVILDQPGAERLLGRGDMLFQAPDAPAPVRLQGVFVSDSEIQRLVTYWQGFSGVAVTVPTAIGGIVDSRPPTVPLKQMEMFEEMAAEEEIDPLMEEAIDLIRRQGRASISMLQRRLRIGYTRAARLIEKIEEKGIISPPEPGSGAREVLDYGQAAPPVDER
jgi:DNA segregation ATPase FtsK/SpoIIIE, S-DNA-T family